MQRNLAHLLDIAHACRAVASFIAGYSESDFAESDLLRSAVARKIEIIGEATRRVSEKFRSAHPEIPWRQMAGMRDRLIHGYGDVDWSKVWTVAAQELPPLEATLSALLDSEEPPT
jgi:uncharacterized protein with HEPN domain